MAVCTGRTAGGPGPMAETISDNTVRVTGGPGQVAAVGSGRARRPDRRRARAGGGDGQWRRWQWRRGGVGVVVVGLPPG